MISREKSKTCYQSQRKGKSREVAQLGKKEEIMFQRFSGSASGAWARKTTLNAVFIISCCDYSDYS